MILIHKKKRSILLRIILVPIIIISIITYFRHMEDINIIITYIGAMIAIYVLDINKKIKKMEKKYNVNKQKNINLNSWWIDLSAGITLGFAIGGTLGIVG